MSLRSVEMALSTPGLDAQGNVRGPYKGIYAELAPSDASELAARSDALGRAFADQGITFSLSGQERPFPLDLVPRVISAAEWSRLERGITQRVKALEMYLHDVYGEQLILREGVIPRRLVTSCEHFHREAAGIVPPNGVRIHVAGIDLIRDAQGNFRVLEDNLRSPSGVSYVMENRRTMARVFPNLFATNRVRAVGDYSSHLLRALRSAAANNVADPTVVVLTPGVYNSAYFEHSLLARQMGAELVEGRDLFCRDNTVYMRTTAGERQVDVIYRRIDDVYLDPMQFRPDSVLGVAGLLNAARAGNVVISSAVGNGVADDKLVYSYVPDLIRYYLSEEPVIAGVYWNRLRRGMRLQADPTVAYALKLDGKWSGTLYRSDYGYASPFNTYLTDGLPPGPICNPGSQALRAAVHPARTEFLYFVADNSGGHVFSRTFEEHLNAISAARRARDAAPEPPEIEGPATPLNGTHEAPPSP